MFHFRFLLAVHLVFSWGMAQDVDLLQQEFRRAVEIAGDPDDLPIYTRLIPVIPGHDATVWKGSGQTAKVKVVTWTSWDGYDDQIGGTMTLTREIWVTLVPQVQDFCRDYQQDDLELRLKKLMGLPPDTTKTKMVEMWVDPDFLFRPCADPEISDQECERRFPESRFMQVSDSHRSWYQALKAKSYGEGGYPWTRLGYTFDWEDLNDPVGVSEFVIVQGAEVEIHAVSPTLAYCGRTDVSATGDK